jgi:hypothetical protein
MKSSTSLAFRVCTVSLLVIVCAAIGALVADRFAENGGVDRRIGTVGMKKPPALENHMKRLRSLPGFGGMNHQGPGSAAVEKFLALAYPESDIALDSLQGARAAASQLDSQLPGSGDSKQPGVWLMLGPTKALYPFTEFRNSFGYVPNAYVAGGRATALAIAPVCEPGNCRLWIFAAGGGVWRTQDALSERPRWRYLSGNFGLNSGSSIEVDPNDPTGNTIYVGTGEANSSADSAAGVGMYKSINGGDTWIGPLGASAFAGRAIGSIEVAPGSPNTVYAATTRAVLGISSVSGGAVSLIPGAAAWGLYKSTDGGATWTFLHNGSSLADACDTVAEATATGSPCSLRGVRRVALDPGDPNIVYAGSYSRGVWRSADGGASWVQIKASLNAADANMRPEIAVTTLPSGDTRMYVHEGSSGSPTSRLFRSDSVATGLPVFANLSNPDPASPGYATHNLCTGQCWYDSFVYTPAGHPDIVYVGGSYSYGETFSNKRGVVLSTDAGVTATDMTMDATDPLHPNGLHPDQHALVTNPSNPYQFFEVNDGGLMRSNGEFADVSSWCTGRGTLTPAQLARCQQLLSRVPEELTGLNQGMSTLQFQSLSASPFNKHMIQGGTQDNGTWQTQSIFFDWANTMIGDGGQSGFDVAEPAFRFHTFFNATPDVNFSHGDIADWNWIADPIFGTEPQSFYVPIISDPVVSRSMFVGTGHVWRTKTWGMGAMDLATFRANCNEWTGTFVLPCGDWQALGVPGVAGRLTGTVYGADRTGGFVAAVERASGDSSTLWAATQTGRLFISKTIDAEPAAAVSFVRLDDDVTVDPNRFISGIAIDPANPNRAFVSYSGFDATTPTTPGHIFLVTYDPAAGTSTWANLSHDFGDLPANDVAFDNVTGDLYAATDFGVYRLASGATDWTRAGIGMPNVEVAGLTMEASAGRRRLLAATHGLGAWLLPLQ